jgi:uncharacterized protein (TIGR02117 family)
MPRVLKKTLKYAGYFLLSFIGFVLVYLLAAFGLAAITIDREHGTKEEVAIYIMTNGVHTDIVVPVKNEQQDWSRDLRFANTQLGDTAGIQYLAMGWGDKGFYLETPTWADLKFSTAFKAATALSTTAIHATYYRDMHEGEDCKKIMISREQYARLISYITQSFQHDNAGHVMYIATKANYGNNDAFYDARGSYSMFYTCNTWANCALKSCGQKACLWTPFDKGIFKKYY